MKIKLLWTIAALTALWYTPSGAYTIDDNYVGGAPTSSSWYGSDVIASSSERDMFNISGIDVSRSGDMATFDIYTGFAGHAGVYASYTRGGTGIGYGDLFLADAWDPYGGAPYANDKASNGTHWQYGLVLEGDRYGNAGGALSLYTFVGGSNGDNAVMSDYYLTGGAHQAIYRGGQEVAVDTSSSYAISSGNVGKWSVEDGYLHLEANLGLTNLLSGSGLAAHWAMSCANDVIEGQAASVPEPTSLALLGVGLLSLAGLAGGKKARSA